MTCNNSPNAPFPFLSNAPPIMPPFSPYFYSIVELLSPMARLRLLPPFVSSLIVTHLTLAHTLRRKHHGLVIPCIPPSIPFSSIIHPVISRRSSSVSASASAHLTRADHYYTLAVGSGRAVFPNAGLASHRQTSSRSSTSTAFPTGRVRPPPSSCPCSCPCPLCSCVCRVSPGLALCWYTR